jgi:hypothetical protein
MKKCPQCGTQYSDDSLSFCLQDGTPLIGSGDDTPTVVLGGGGAPVTRRDAVRVPVGDPSITASGEGPFNRAVPPPVQKKSSNIMLAVIGTAVVMLIVFGIIGLAAILYYRNAQVAGVQNANVPPAPNVPTVNKNSVPPASPARTAAPSSPAPSPASSPGSPVLSSYPSTSRLKFAKGSYSTSFSGEINPGDTRSLVLSCRSGQLLSANVESSSNCVTFRGGGTSLATTTTGGDNYITVLNHCSSVAHFTVDLSII